MLPDFAGYGSENVPFLCLMANMILFLSVMVLSKPFGTTIPSVCVDDY